MCLVMRGRTLQILSNNEKCKGLIKELKTQNKLFLAIGLFPPEGGLGELKEEISFPNGFIGDFLVNIIQIHKCKEPDLIHAKLFSNSHETREEAVLRAKLHTSKKRIKIVPIDVNREVRRCFMCNSYEHTSTHCTEITPACGKCVLQHD